MVVVALNTFHRACPVFLYGVLWVGWVGGSPGGVVIANLFLAMRLVSWIAGKTKISIWKNFQLAAC